MSDYRQDKKAEKRAHKYRWLVWCAVPAVPFGLWFWFAVASPIICGVTAGCGSASW